MRDKIFTLLMLIGAAMVLIELHNIVATKFDVLKWARSGPTAFSGMMRRGK